MFDSKYTNKSVYPNGKTVNVRLKPTTTSDIIETYNGYVGRTTGAYLKMSDGIWFLVNLANNIKHPFIKQGYVRADVITFKEPSNDTVTLNKAQDMLNKLVESDKQVYTTLIKLAPTVKRLRQTGAIDANTLHLYKSLCSRLYSRQQAFIDTKLVQYKKGDLKGYDQEKKDLAELYEAIGIIPIVVGIIIGVIVAASAATICYYAFKPNYEDSKADFVLSKELDTTLKKKLTQAEYDQLKKEGEKNVDDAYNAGKNKGKIGLGVQVATFLGGFWLLDRYVLSRNKGGK